FAAGRRGRLVAGTRHGGERHADAGRAVGGGAGAPGAGRRDARRFAFHLLVVRRPGRIGEAGGIVARRQLQQAFERAGGGVDPRLRIAAGREARRHRRRGEVGGVTVRHLVPAEGRRDARVGERTNRV